MDFNIPTIITKRNTDSNGSPISVKLVELRQVMDNHSCVVLSQIPCEVNRVTIDGFTEVFDIENLDYKSFRVDYAQGVVYFHPFNVGKGVTIEYYGTGFEMISASRIFSKLDKNGNTIDVLENILERSELQLDLVESLGGAIKVIEKLDIDIKSANDLNTYFDEKIPEATGLKNELNTVVADAKGWKDQLKQDVADGKVIQPKLQKNVEDAKVLQPLLNNDVTVGTPLQKNLHSDIVEAKKWKDQLHNDVEEGKVLRPLLEQTVNDGNITKQQLDQSIVNAQDDIAKIEATGNFMETISIASWDTVIENGMTMYTKNINHNLNSNAIIVQIISENQGALIGWTRLDKNNILLKSDDRVLTDVIIASKYYKATQTISDDVVSEIIEARKGSTSLGNKISDFDISISNINENVNDLVIEKHNHANKDNLDSLTLEKLEEWNKNTKDIIELNQSKVDKLEGKGLSSNDFTSELLELLELWRSFKNNGGDIGGTINFPIGDINNFTKPITILNNTMYYRENVINNTGFSVIRRFEDDTLNSKKNQNGYEIKKEYGSLETKFLPLESEFDIGSTAKRIRNLFLINSPNVSSKRELKENIVIFDDNQAYENLNNMKIYKYNYINGDGEEMLGSMLDELPSECINEKAEGVDLYAYTSYVISALKVAINKIKNLELEVEALKTALSVKQ